MTLEDAHKVLAARYAEVNPPRFSEVLRAHAALWRNGSTPEHADYCEEAAMRIERLEDAVRDALIADGYHPNNPKLLSGDDLLACFESVIRRIKPSPD